MEEMPELRGAQAPEPGCTGPSGQEGGRGGGGLGREEGAWCVDQKPKRGAIGRVRKVSVLTGPARVVGCSIRFYSTVVCVALSLDLDSLR